MRTWNLWTGLLVAAIFLCSCAQDPIGIDSAPDRPPALIERAKFFGNPSRIEGKISPDGRWISWIAPREGVLNVWAAPISDLAQARALTNERTRPIYETPDRHFKFPHLSTPKLLQAGRG